MKIKYYQRPDRPGIWMAFKDAQGKRQRVATSHLTEAEAVRATPALLASFFQNHPENGAVHINKQSTATKSVACGCTLQAAFNAGCKQREEWLVSRKLIP